jgi:RND family efflux transporter MFP subunit
MTLPRIPRKYMPVALIAVGLMGFFLLVATRPAKMPAEVRERAWTVAVETVTPAAQAPVLTLYGAVESPRAAVLTAAVAAYVAGVPVTEGAVVAAGEPLVVLDDRDARLVLAQREAQVTSARRSHGNDVQALARERELLRLTEKGVERAQLMVARNLGPQSALDEANAALERQRLSLASRELAVADYPQRLAQLEAQRDQARLDVERTRIVAPFTGRVADLHVAPGDRVRVGDRIAEIYDVEGLEMRATVPASWLPAVRAALVGAGAEQIRAAAVIDGVRHALRLIGLSGRAGAGGAGVDALLRFEQGAPEVQLGRFAEVYLYLPPVENAVALPHEALYGRDRIYRLHEGRMAALPVERLGETVGEDGVTRLLLRSPQLVAGDRVVVTRLPNAMDGLRVVVAE